MSIGRLSGNKKGNDISLSKIFTVKTTQVIRSGSRSRNNSRSNSVSRGQKESSVTATKTVTKTASKNESNQNGNQGSFVKWIIAVKKIRTEKQ